MRKDGEQPKCCDKGNEHIRWHIKLDVGWGFTGWGMCVGYFDGKLEYEQIGYCPFCGKKLDWVDEHWVTEMLVEE